MDSVNGWRSSLYLSEEECEDLQFVIDNLDKENGQPFLNHQTGVTLNEILGRPENSSSMETLYRPVSSGEQLGGVMASDASSFMGFAYSVSDQDFSYQEQFSEEETLSSSGERELLTIVKTILDNTEYFASGSSMVQLFYLVWNLTLYLLCVYGSGNLPI